MAGIKTSITLKDGVTPILDRINKRLSLVQKSTKTLEKAFVGFDAIIKSIPASQGKVVLQQDKMTRSTNATLKSQEQLNQSRERTKQSILSTLQSVEKTKQATQQTIVGEEKIKQSVQKTLQQRQKTTQEVHKTAFAEAKVKVETNKILSSAQRLNNEKKWEVLLNQRIRGQIDRNKQAQDKYNRSILQGATNYNHVWAALRRGTTAYLGTQSALGIVNTSDALTMSTARLDLMNDGLQTTAELQNMIYESAMRSRSGYLDMTQAVSKVAMQAGSLFRSGGKQNNAAIVQFMENYNKMAAISGATAQQTSAAMLQITQALSSGELRGDELRSVLENMPVVADYLAKKMGVARDQILSLGHDGKISAETLRDAIMGATDDLNEKMKKIPYTWVQVWTLFKNAALKAFQPILNGISALIKNEKFQNFARMLGNALNAAGRLATWAFGKLGNALGWVYDKAVIVANFFKNNWSAIAPFVLGVAAALVVIKAVSIAIAAWSAAQAVLNAIMAANPVMLVVLGVLALIAVIAAVITYMNETQGTAISVTGVIAGAVRWLGALIWNILKGIANIAIGVAQWVVNAWNWACDNMGIIFDNIGTFWDNLWIDCRIGLNNFLAWALGKLASLAETLQPLAELLDIDTSGLSKMAAKAKNKSGSLEKNKGKYKSLKSFDSYGQVNWETYAYTDLSEAYDKGYAWGEKFENKFKDKLGEIGESISGGSTNDFIKGLTNGFDNTGSSSNLTNPALDKIAKDTGDIAKNTGKSEEDFSYLRELAEREAINKYTLTDLKIDMTNNNNISNGVDSDNLMQRLAKQLSEAVLSTAEGITPW